MNPPGTPPSTEKPSRAVAARVTTSEPLESAFERMVERAADALRSAEWGFGYSIRLTRLVDGESTYSLTYDDIADPLEFPTYAEANEHVTQRRHVQMAEAILRGAAAPDLAELLREGLESAWCDAVIGCAAEIEPKRAAAFRDHFYDWQRRARAAIAKATGADR